jgi:plastocyanin
MNDPNHTVMSEAKMQFFRFPRALTLCGAVLSLALLPLLAGCGEAADYEPTDIGARRYGAPPEGAVKFGEGGTGAVAVGDVPAGVPAPVAQPDKPNPPVAGPPPRSPGGGNKGSKLGKYKVDPSKLANAGVIEGVVKFGSKPEPNKPVAITKDLEACGGHSTKPSERLVFDEANLTIKDCVIFLVDIKAGKDWTGELAKGPDDRIALLDQKDCVYVPHILICRPETQIRVKNSDPAEHNVHTYVGSTSGSTGFNVLTPTGSTQDPGPGYIEKVGPYPVKCDIHAWMSGTIWCLPHPYYAVTAVDGKFRLEGVPPGTYQIRCWHAGMQETPIAGAGGISGYDYGQDVEVTQSVTVEAGGTAKVDFTLDAPTR